MSIATPTWTPLQTVGQPLYTLIPDVPTVWTRIPSYTTVQGYGFGQGGFGQGGFGGNPSSQSGPPIPNWIPWITD
jgi:hypothetical protein